MMETRVYFAWLQTEYGLEPRIFFETIPAHLMFRAMVVHEIDQPTHKDLQQEARKLMQSQGGMSGNPLLQAMIQRYPRPA